MRVRVAAAVAGTRPSASVAPPSTSHRSSGANGTNHPGGTAQVQDWMNTRSDEAWPCQQAKSRSASSAWPAANAVASSGRAVERSRASSRQDRAHELVLKAKEQVGFLTPLVAACDERGNLAAKVDTLRACREALRPWFATRKRGLLEKRIANLDAEIEKLAHRIAALAETRSR